MIDRINIILAVTLVVAIGANLCAFAARTEVSGHQEIGTWLISYNELHSERNQVLASALGMKK